ncbi:cell wall hydrolase [Novosphingobium sp.]|uniref:cell wall hydrolase n=1 Tax=Novosphingobium sp. TaxID=1874826 RepID=UPI00286D1503|nr:cell wall hydrolase [Novosphingobium sp.]
MDDPLNRRMIVALLAFVPLLLVLLAGRNFSTPQRQPGQPTTAQAAEIAALPGGAIEAPLFGSDLPPAMLAPGAMDAARASNLQVPFVSGPIATALPFRFSGNPGDFGNARDCLALAAMAEAGASDQGQRAVIQVILNRVRHPAFASTVCGVVFEGSQRATGCQFTFTCDGSLTRRYGDADWAASRTRAEQALRGYVYAGVGTATHYHTDWVFPSWSPKLEKIAQVETHLFFRWPGRWGTTAAMTKPYRGGEASFAQLSAPGSAGAFAGTMPGDFPTGRPDLSDPDASFAVATGIPALPSDTPAVSSGEVVMRLPNGRANFIIVSAGAGSDVALATARSLCNGQGTCRVMGWSNRGDVPVSFPLPRAARDSLQFSYSRDPAGSEITLYNCESFAGVTRDKCIPRGR